MVGNPRFGFVGLGVLPYTTLFEGFAPMLEGAGYVIATVSALCGFLDWSHYRVLLMVSVMFGAASTLLAVLFNDVTSRRYMRPSDLNRLIAAALIENVGYRQLNSWWSWVGTLQALRGRGGWGPMKRRAF